MLGRLIWIKGSISLSLSYHEYPRQIKGRRQTSRRPVLALVSSAQPRRHPVNALQARRKPLERPPTGTILSHSLHNTLLSGARNATTIVPSRDHQPPLRVSDYFASTASQHNEHCGTALKHFYAPHHYYIAPLHYLNTTESLLSIHSSPRQCSTLLCSAGGRSGRPSPPRAYLYISDSSRNRRSERDAVNIRPVAPP